MLRWLKAWIEAFRLNRATEAQYKAATDGFGYALSVLREETDPCLLRQLSEQAESDRDDPFCLGMRIAIAGYRK
ncbi:hypothetical protein [Variovorax ginsengisoli]|uniref:Uncharacterized protein n=1 Tax=Variovorax ginsengisoli TaxID=363844 RepID=A0ABT8RZ52_9BURK|nr:hypothetical protein [Variovorax ginsengisoli]MDN8612776.1 hypothetical protein [Variovorax ginsengisoli]MDO1531946.1 hypothetical protein [Variovorax ginsengisoli]